MMPTVLISCGGRFAATCSPCRDSLVMLMDRGYAPTGALVGSRRCVRSRRRRTLVNVNDRLAKLEKLHAADPTDGFVLYALGQEHAKARDFTKAIEFYDRLM